MAQWGVAMSHYHGLWDNGDTAAGREAIGKARGIAAENATTSPRERAYIDALAEIYKEDAGDNYVRGQAYEKKMAELQASYLEDSEAAIFHARALDIVAPKTD